ncbi:MAG: lipopolysaccharide biosynthesis protein [Bacteroidia bacterium]|nr:lipopolysaccharide biosynthesis protein [Bacteroidia bacterium]
MMFPDDEIKYSNDLRNKALTGFYWSAIDQIVVGGIQILFGLLLARWLLPSDFGLIGMVTIVVVVGQSVINGGFHSALIQKRNPTDQDFSTVFIFGVVSSIVVYILIFICAPWIAAFYDEPGLTLLTRVLCLSFIFNSWYLVHQIWFSKQINFQIQAKINFLSITLSGIVGIVLALYGFGVWALVFQMLARRFVSVLTYWVVSPWWPKLQFNRKSLMELFPYGSRIMMSVVSDKIFSNLYLVVIGKLFNASALGFYATATKVQLLPVGLTYLVQRVSFPVFSSIQNEGERLKSGYKKLLRFIVFSTMPIMGMLIITAEPLVNLLLTDKWGPAVPYIQLISAFAWIYPLQDINLNILKVKGKSGLFLRLEIINKVLITISILVTYRFGIVALILGQLVCAVLAYFLDSYVSGKSIDYRLKEQLKDIAPAFFITLFMMVSVYLLTWKMTGDLFQLTCRVVAGFVMYILTSLVFNRHDVKMLKDTLLDFRSWIKLENKK